ncbi:hypothetical protein Tco_1299027 [Tanacetum coccineum]
MHEAGSSGDGVGLEPEAPDEPKGKSINTHEGTGLKPGVPDVSKADSSDSEYASWGISNDDDDDDDQQDDVDDEEYDRINKEMYDDVNVELKDAEPADEGKVQDEAQATTTAAPAQVASFSRSVSSNYGSIFLNLDNISSVETEIISMLDVQVQHENPSIYSSSLLTIPVSVIPEPTVLSSIPENITIAPDPFLHPFIH